MDYEEERKRINCIDEIHQINSKYEDGIIDLKLFQKAKYKILWILKETNGKFSIAHFKNATELDKGKWKTWKNIAKINSLILDGKQSSKSEQTDYLRQTAIINLNKTFGKSSTKMKTFKKNYLCPENEKTRLIVQEQIKNIRPDIIICGNTLNLLSKQLNFRESIKIEPIPYTKKNNMYCFSNVVFINAYHPCYPTYRPITLPSDKYCEAVVNSVNKWIEWKKTMSLSKFNFDKL